jgi:hypothetical protein
VNVIMGHSDALDQLTPAHYYRFLDCGVRIGLGNGSDHPARVAGVCRVYVKSGPALDYSRWCDELAAGKSFTTSGPLLFLEVDGIGPGETIDARPGQEVHVTARAWSRRPIGNLQVVTNGGRVVAQLNTGRTEAEVSFRHVVDGPAWFTARCAPGEDHNALDGRDIAHTSAAYVRVGGRDSLDPEAAQWFAGNVRAHRERLLATANFESDEQKAQTLAWIDAGLARYEAIAGGRPLKELDDEAGRLARGM